MNELPLPTTNLPEKHITPVVPQSARPRIWPVFVVPLCALVVAILVQTAVTLVLVALHLANSSSPQQLRESLLADLSSPPMFLGLAGLSQLVFASSALLAARWSPEPMVLRLGLRLPPMRWWVYPLLMVGTLPTLVVGIGLALWLAEFIPPDPSVKRLYEQMTLAWAVPFVLFIALGPGLCEELLFRGYVQRRLLARWRPWLAVLMTTTIFALFHLMPHAVVNAFVIGLWLGFVAWRTGSIWPSAACHAGVNGAWNVLQLGQKFEYLPEQPSLPVMVSAGVVMLICFGLSLWILLRRPPVAFTA